MSSIFTDNFNAVIKRVYSNHDNSTNKKEEKLSTKEDFSSVIASIEVNKQNEKNSSVLNKQDLNKILTNLIKDTEVNDKNNSHKSSFPPSPSIIIGDIPLEETNDQISLKSVNNPANSDKKITSEIFEPKLPVPESNSIKKNKLNGTKKISLGKQVKKPDINKINEKNTISKDKIKEIIITAGKYHGVDPGLGLAIAEVESAFNPNAVSIDGHESKGVFQLLDSTAMDMKNLTGISEPYAPFDPSMNSFLGLSYLRRLLDIFSKESELKPNMKTTAAKTSIDLEKIAVAAYNTGEGNVAKAQARAKSLGKDPSEFSSIEPHLPKITKDYVKKVTEIRNNFSSDLFNSLSFNG